MNLSLKSEIKNFLKKHQLQPLKRLGQNFLTDGRAVSKVIRAADLRAGEVVLEIGPGLGILTRELAKKVKKVIAVEKDRALVRLLDNELKVMKIKNVKVVRGDILKIINSEFLINNSYKVVANLPFYLTAPVIRRFLEAALQPKLIALIIQREVAQRICAKVPDMNLLAVSVQFYAQPKIISYISKKSFWPRPKVDSAIIKIIPNNKQVTIDRKLFFKIVKAGFSQPRKQLINNLSKKLRVDKIKTEAWLWKSNIQPTQRAETLTVKDWLNLTKTFLIPYDDVK
jgi:16S rRNA (adenine1518-N6/adenine1519-N6)-dimethyltransferase